MLDITERKLSELALAEQLKFETVLAGLLTTFINLTPSQLDGQIVEAQKRICETLGLDRSSLAVVPVEGDDLIITHSWAAEGFNRPPAFVEAGPSVGGAEAAGWATGEVCAD